MDGRVEGLGFWREREEEEEESFVPGRGGNSLHPRSLGRKWRSHGCQNVVPNSNDVVDSHLTRDYPLNGGLRPAANGRLVHANPVITGLEFTSKLHPL